MTYPIAQSARRNDILAALPILDYANLCDNLESVDLMSGQVIDEPGTSFGFVYFPVTCTVSLVSSTQDGEMSELAITGREGLVGVASVLGMPTMNHRAMVMCAGQAYRMSAHAFESATAQSETFRRLTLRYVQALMTQMAQSIVCSRHHSVLQRLSFWLLFNQDRAASDELKVTHEVIAHMLGVRRESITQAAGLLQTSGWIRTSRGKIRIENSIGLRGRACECYGLMNTEYARLNQPMMPSLKAINARSTPWPAQVHRADEDIALPLELAPDRKYADIFDFAPVGLLSVDGQGQMLEVNMAAAILLGVQRSQSAYHLFIDFLTSDSREEFRRFHAEVMTGKCRRHCELKLAATAQRPLMVVRIDATVDEDGLENRMVMFDITEQVQQSMALVAREREQHDLLAHLPGVFWIKDESGGFVAVNPLANLHNHDAAQHLRSSSTLVDVHSNYGFAKVTEPVMLAVLKT
jgi:CRP-like cAMP-binding protein